jgi:pyrroloquinoline quinone biosynthesis protein D
VASSRSFSAGSTLKTLNSSSQPRLVVGCRVREAESGLATLLVPEGVLRLKGTAIDILRLCDGQRTLGEILQEMQARYQSADPKHMEQEIETFLSRLQQRRVIDF